MSELQKTRFLVYGKQVGGPKLPQVHAELTEWERAAGKNHPGAADWAAGPDRAVEHLDDLDAQPWLMPWAGDPARTVCMFCQDGQLFVTEPADSPAAAAAQALHFVLERKSALT